MKLKSVFLTLVICFSVNAFPAQDGAAPLAVSVSVKEPKISFYAKSVLIDIKITNNSAAPINTIQLGRTGLKLSKDLGDSSIERSEMAVWDVAPKTLNSGESIDFQVDLKKVLWLPNSQLSSFPAYIERETGYRPLLLGQYYLSAVIGSCYKDAPLKDSLSRSDARSCQSNKVLLDFEKPVSTSTRDSIQDSFSRKNKIDIQVFLKDRCILKTAKNIPVRIKVTNRSKKMLDTADLGRIFLYFSNCPKTEIGFCRLYFAGVEIKPRRLKMNRSAEFESNLSDLIWTDLLSSYLSTAKNFDIIPPENIYFYAAIPTRKNVLPDGVRLPEDYLSNQLTVSFRSK